MSEYSWMTPISQQRHLAHYMPHSDQPQMVRAVCGSGPFNTAFARVEMDAPFCGRCQSKLAILEREA